MGEFISEYLGLFVVAGFIIVVILWCWWYINKYGDQLEEERNKRRPTAEEMKIMRKFVNEWDSDLITHMVEKEIQKSDKRVSLHTYLFIKETYRLMREIGLSESDVHRLIDQIT